MEWYLNGQQIRKSKRFQLWYDGLHHLEINPARAYDTGSLVAVAVNKVGQAQASCTVDVEPLGDLRSNLKRVDGSSPDASLRAMRMNRKVETEKQTEILGEYQKRSSKTKSSFPMIDALTNEQTHLLDTNDSSTKKRDSKGLKLKIPKRNGDRQGTPQPNSANSSATSPAKNAFIGAGDPELGRREFEAKLSNKRDKLKPVNSSPSPTKKHVFGGRL